MPAIRVAELEHVHLEFLEEPPAAGARITGRMGNGDEAVPICRRVGCPRSNASAWVGRGGGGLGGTSGSRGAGVAVAVAGGHRPPVPGGKGRPGIMRWVGDDGTCPQAGGRPAGSGAPRTSFSVM